MEICFKKCISYNKIFHLSFQQLVGQEFSFPRLQTHEQPVLACFRKLSSPVDGNKASEGQNAKSSVHCKLETPDSSEFIAARQKFLAKKL